ncbi:MAG: hypothetical protein R2856_03435 [Caldilineaceae bacterium]
MTQTSTIESRIDDLLAQMTLEEKIGQMWQISGKIDGAEEIIRRGGVGSFLNVEGDMAHELQRIAVEESRLGIPLIYGRCDPRFPHHLPHSTGAGGQLQPRHCPRRRAGGGA